VIIFFGPIPEVGEGQPGPERWPARSAPCSQFPRFFFFRCSRLESLPVLAVPMAIDAGNQEIKNFPLADDRRSLLVTYDPSRKVSTAFPQQTAGTS